MAEEARRLATPLRGVGADAAFLCCPSGGLDGFAARLPAFVVVGMGVDATRALVLSQVGLSLALPVAMIALVLFTSRRDVMGEFANGRWTRGAAIIGATVVLALNVVLLQTFGVPIPGLG